MAQAANYLHCEQLLDFMALAIADLIRGMDLWHRLCACGCTALFRASMLPLAKTVYMYTYTCRDIAPRIVNSLRFFAHTLAFFASAEASLDWTVQKGPVQTAGRVE